MSYIVFLFIFIIIPAVLLAIMAKPERREWAYIGLLVAAAYVWTTPWDNYLVATGVWSYNPNLVLGITLGWVPLEEYLFFGIMTVLSGCLALLLVRTVSSRPVLARWLAGLAGVLVLVALLGLQRESSPPGSRPETYLTLILVWAAPVILGQIALGWRSLFQRWPLWVTAALLPTLYLTAMDSIALHGGTWRIDPGQSFNLFLPGRVPIEEGVFFLATNLMIVQGLLLALDPQLRTDLSRRYSALRRVLFSTIPRGRE